MIMKNKLISKIVWGLIITLFVSSCSSQQDQKAPSIEQNQILYDSVVNGIHITPGAWRPLFGTEHVAWVSPSWSSEEFIWLDFPEAIFSGSDLIFLSHIDTRFPAKYNNLPKIEWQNMNDGIRFERELPNGIKFGGSVVKKDKISVELKIWIYNGSSEPFTDIKLQTCAYLNEIEEFEKNSNANKLVHTPKLGWTPLNKAQHMEDLQSNYYVGWRGGPKVADLPVIIALSEVENHLVALTWFDNTYSIIGNENHPCFHADPFFPDIKPGQKHTITGELIFFEGSVKEFEKMFAKRMKIDQ